MYFLVYITRNTVESMISIKIFNLSTICDFFKSKICMSLNIAVITTTSNNLQDNKVMSKFVDLVTMAICSDTGAHGCHGGRMTF